MLKRLFRTIYTSARHARLHSVDAPAIHFETVGADGAVHRFRYLNGAPLNDANFELEVNFLEYWETRPDGRVLHFSWAADLPIDDSNAFGLARPGAPEAGSSGEQAAKRPLRRRAKGIAPPADTASSTSRHLLILIVALVSSCLTRYTRPNRHSDHVSGNTWEGLGWLDFRSCPK